ncbi:MAG: polyisoprenoid-binding protein [Proteobacteria bacterium]|nr:polyisoprenoid-binding protein [Pseudomonadota bacterium]
MNKYKAKMGIVLMLFALSAQAQNKAQPQENYTLDRAHSYVLWHIDHFGFSEPSGKWYANGTLVYDPNKIENSKVDVTIDVADVITGISKLDDHIKSGEFLNVAQFPKATFVSDKIESTSSLTAKVTGTLNLHGVAKPITLDVIINKVGLSPVSQKQTIGFSAHGKLKRSDYGINAYLPGLGDEISLEIQGEATLKE